MIEAGMEAMLPLPLELASAVACGAVGDEAEAEPDVCKFLRLRGV